MQIQLSITLFLWCIFYVQKKKVRNSCALTQDLLKQQQNVMNITESEVGQILPLRMDCLIISSQKNFMMSNISKIELMAMSSLWRKQGNLLLKLQQMFVESQQMQFAILQKKWQAQNLQV